MTKTIWGPKLDGSTGAMNEGDFIAFVIDKVGDGGPTWQKNAGKAYQAITNHVGQAGANRKFPHKGKSICHVSEGKRSSSDGISVFFTSKDQEVASIVGIGQHTESASYKLEWQLSTWNTGGSKEIKL